MRAPAILALSAVAAFAVAVPASESPAVGRLLIAAGLPQLAAALADDPALRGAALLAAGRPAEAAEAHRRTRSATTAYNLGNALALTGDFAGAIKAYDLALARDPLDRDAAANRLMVQAVVQAAEAAPPPEAPPGEGLANSGAVDDHRSGSDDTAGEDSGAQAKLGDGMAGTRETGSDSLSPGTGKVERTGAGRSGPTPSGEGSTRGAATAAAGKAGTGGGMTDMAESSAAPGERPPEAVAQETQQATLQWLSAIPDDPGRFLRIRIAAERERRIAAGLAVNPGGPGW